MALSGADTSSRSALDKQTLEEYVRHLLFWGPQIKVEISKPEPSELDGFQKVRVRGSAGSVSQEQVFYISADGKKLVRATVYDVTRNPFEANISKLDTEHQPNLGTPNAPVKIVLFSDFQCGYCRGESQTLRKELLKAFPKQVRLYYVNFPLESIHPWSKSAAMASRCFYAQSNDAFWAFHDWIFEHQNEITADNLHDKVLEFGGTLPNVDALKLGRCLDTKATAKEVDRSLAMARSLKLNSTPTLFINGRKIASQVPWPSLKQVIELEIGYQKTAKDAGDGDCCSVKLPTPLDK